MARGRAFGFLAACVVPASGAWAADTSWTMYNQYTTSYFIPYYSAPNYANDRTNIEVLANVAIGGQTGPSIAFEIDTGSVGMALPLYDAPGAVVSGQQYLKYSSSDLTGYGGWVNAKVTFAEGTRVNGERPSAELPVFVVSKVVDKDGTTYDCSVKTPEIQGKCFYMMGVGYGRPASGDSPPVTPQENPLLHLQGMNMLDPNAPVRAGYVIGPNGIQAGLTADNVGSGFSYVKLTSIDTAGVPDWKTLPGQIYIDHKLDANNSTVLLDTGISYLWTSLGGEPHVTCIPPSGTTEKCAKPGTAFTIAFGAPGNPHQVSYSYVADGSANSELAPWYTRLNEKDGEVNTGIHPLAGFIYFYDAVGGYVGLSAVPAMKGDLTFSPSLATTGSMSLPDGFGTNLPVYVSDATSFVPVSSASFSGEVSGPGVLTIAGAGSVLLSGNVTLPAIAVTGGTLGVTATVSASVSVSEGATFQSTGLLKGAVDNAGTFRNGGTMLGDLTNRGGAGNLGAITGAIANSGALANAGTLTGALTNAASGTVQNSGTMAGDVDNSGIVQNAGHMSGNVKNSGQFSLDANGRLDGNLTNTARTLNAGTISGTVTNSGTFLNGGLLAGTLDNSAQAENGGTIQGNALNSGSYTNGGLQTGTVTNTGTFLNSGTLAGSLVNSVNADNVGTIQGDATNSGSYVNRGTHAGAVDNTGTFSNGGLLAGTLTNKAKAENGASIQGDVTNSGTYTNSGTQTGGVTNTGLFVNAGALYGNLSNGANAENTGLIQGAVVNSGTYSNGGTQAGPVTNTGTFSNAAILTGDLINGATAVNAGTLTGTVTNTGTFTNTGTLAGFLSNGSVAANSGTIQGDAFNSGAYVNSGRQNGAVTNVGTFTNAGLLSGRLSNTGVAQNSATIQGNVGNAGTFSNDGLVTGSVTNEGLLIGNGTIGGNLVSTGRTSPGHSLGVISVSGTAQLSSGSVYTAEVGPNGTSDLLAVGGVLETQGSTLQVIALPGYNPNLGSSYTLITAGGGVVGSFVVDTLGFGAKTSLYPFLATELSMAGGGVSVTLVRSPVQFAELAITANQRAVAAAADMLPVSTPLASALAGVPLSGAAVAFTQLEGDIYASALSVLQTQSSYVRNAVTGRLLQATASQPSAGPRVFEMPGLPGATLWGQAYAGWGANDGNLNAAGYSSTVGGFIIGLDALMADWRVGLAAGFSQSQYDLNSGTSSGESDNYDLAVYAGRSFGPLNLRLGAAYSWHDVSSQRAVALPNFFQAYTAGYDGGTAQVFGEVGYGIAVPGLGVPAVLEPFAGLSYVSLSTNGFSESFGAAALTGGSTTFDTLSTTLGLRGALTVAAGTMPVTLTGTLGWQHAYGDLTPTASLAFAAGGPSFTVSGAPLAADALILAAGLSAQVGQNISLGVSYSGQIASTLSENAVKGTFVWAF